MNKTKYMQTDSRWGNLGYPKAPCYLRNCGCGELAVCNAIIEMEKYKKYTPKNINSYCKQFASASCDGTYWYGIPKMMEHYGLLEVKECPTMSELWKELGKGNRVAIYLMGSRRGGSEGVHWTSSGHFVCSVDYRLRNGYHEVYMKDSYSNSSYRNGWISYEKNLKGDVVKVWCGKLPSVPRQTKTYKPTTPYKGKIPAKNIKLGDNGEDVKRLQNFLNWAVGCHLNGKGFFRSATDKYLKIWQSSRGLEADGIFGTKSRAEAKKMVAEYDPKKETAVDKELDACKTQAEWMKNYDYSWPKWKPRNVAQSKKYGTCVTYVACVLQRLGYLKSGEYLWNNGKGYGTGKVYIWGSNGKRSIDKNDKMTVTYMGNKTLKSLKGKLKAGDIVMVDDNKSGESGSGGHIFILTGKWTDDGKPYIWDNQSANRVKAGKSGKHTYGSGRKVLAVVRLKEK